ncbi:MAG: iron-sulfur cluster assembly scaffold protein, partial [Acidobacteriales bacterium]|nr:iron-sulfur cluster assembly scaffold protein [Terriglobales bacterium]
LDVLRDRAELYMYSEAAVAHFQCPRNRGPLAGATHTGRACHRGRAPFVTLDFQVVGDGVEKATFDAAGCGATIAACSVATEMLFDRTVSECLALTVDELDQALGGLPAHKRFCAALVIDAIEAALR